MVDITLEGNRFKLCVQGNSDNHKKTQRDLIKKIPGYEYVRSGDYYYVPIIELKSIISILGHNNNFLDDKKFVVEEYNKAITDLKNKLSFYNPSNFLKTINTDKEYSFLKLPPKPFQKLAIEWSFVKKGPAQIYGGLIADEVGLGKTFESISSICNFIESGKCKSGIIICPANMRFQWAGEIERFTYHSFKIMSSGKREKKIEELKNFKETFLIMSYELYKNYAEDIQTLKEENSNLDFSFIIVDEAHKMKDIKSATYKKISMLNPEVKILLTATPIKRDVDDLYALFNYLSPDILMGWTYFKNKFLEFTFKFGQEVCTGGKKETRAYLHWLIAPYMIRRKSTDVSNEIPELIEKFIPITPTKEQKKWFKIFSDEMDKALQQAEQAFKEDKLKLVELRENAFKSKFQALSTCSDHLALLSMSPSKITQKLIEHHKILDFKSPKMDWLIDFIENNIVQNNEFFGDEGKEKLVVFTQFERMIGFMEQEIESKLMKKYPNSIKYMRFTGKIEKGCNRLTKDKLPTNCFECTRKNECNSTEKAKFLFVNDPNVNILLCTDAAQVGLNLQVARFLVNYDLPWSPGSIEQRIGRVKRLGSKYKNVIAYNLYAQDSLDEKIVKKLEKRRDHINNIVESSEAEKEAYAKHLPSLD